MPALPSSPLAASIILWLALGTAACAPPGPYPSLEQRPIEKALAATDEPPPEAPLPDDAGLPDRIAALTAEARRGQAAFEAALPDARAAAGRAGTAESESWIEAQQALSRLETASAVTGKALADIDALALAEEQKRRLSPGDLERLAAAVRDAQEMADRQKDEVARLKGMIGE